MEPWLVTTFGISEADFNAMKAANSGVIVRILYYFDAPAGYEISMVEPGGTKILCARPCPTYHPPVQP